jgi:mRNA-decapping enzyme subunit 2
VTELSAPHLLSNHGLPLSSFVTALVHTTYKANHESSGLDDLCVRFIINLPEDDLSSVHRICFQVEEAQWYYEDFIRPLDPTLPSMSLRSFCLRIFAHCPLLSAFSQGDHMRAFEEFLMYKSRIPVRGAIMLNEAMDSAVLVKGWKKGANWSFPRGKINKDEDDLICAIREVYEETGYDLEAAGLVPESREVKYIEINIREQQLRLYVFRDVPMDTHFEPRTRKEISKIQWWHLSELPAFRKKSQQQQPEAAVHANKFYMVAPFLVPLRKWVVEQKKRDAKRTSNNQYLSAGMSHDEFLTEEDQGTESNTQGPSYAAASVPELNTFEGATAALHRLLKIQPPTQGLQTDAMAGQSPAVKNSGEALLALLHGKPLISDQQPSSNPQPHTTLDHTLIQAPLPRTPHHHQPRPPHFSSLPPPPAFPIQLPRDSFSYQERDFHDNIYPAGMTGSQQSLLPNLQQPQRPHGPPHSYQPQHLIHPQPLPPHVQRAVFTGGPVHAPMVPQPVQQHAPHLNATVSISVPSPQFPGLHAPMIPSMIKQTPPKLTSHSLALLNAFKSRDQANGDAAASSDLLLRRYTEESIESTRSQPQELPAELSRPIPEAVPSQAGEQRPRHTLNPSGLYSRPPISDAHRSTLLDLFKIPTAQPAVLSKSLAATALPTTTTPSAVELSAVEPLSTNAVTTSALLNNKRTPDYTPKNGTIPELNPEANLPFRAMSILTRPSQANNQDIVPKTIALSKAQSNGKKPVSSIVSDKSQKSPEKPFQPQILKRPQQNVSITNESPTALHTLQAPSPFPTLPTQPSFDRRTSQPADHKQTLLSLFGKAPAAANPLSRISTTDGISSLPQSDPPTSMLARSRVESIASGEGAAASRRGSQTPISPADKGFLLSYLDAVTKSQR